MKKLRKTKIKGTSLKPRLKIFKSNRFFYSQVINDDKNITMCSASNIKLKETGSKSLNAIADTLIKNLKINKVNNLVFDRGNYRFCGNVELFVNILRKNGIKI